MNGVGGLIGADIFTAFRSQGGLREVSVEVLPVLRSLLNQRAWADPYVGSAAYFALTGRRGLWLYEGEDGCLLICRHPNAPEELLLFPPWGRHPGRLIREALEELPETRNAVSLARVPADGGPGFISRLVKAVPGQAISLGEERRLDWRYPVHVLDTGLVSRHTGKAFRDFRQNVHRAGRAGLSIEPLVMSRHRPSLDRLVAVWADRYAGARGGEPAEMEAPFSAAFDLMEAQRLPIHGLVVRAPVGLRGFITWEETDPVRGVANSLTNLSLGPEKGVAELSFLAMCRTLAERGFQQVCVGGSEEVGLDAFKRKMQPVRSIAMLSIGIAPAFQWEARPRHGQEADFSPA